MEKRAHFREEFLVLDGVPSGIGGYCIVRVGNQGHLVRNDLHHEVPERLGDGISFYVEFRREQWTDGPYVAVTYVALVRPGMHRDALGAEFLAVEGRQSYVRHVAAARIAEGGYLINIDAEFGHNDTKVAKSAENRK